MVFVPAHFGEWLQGLVLDESGVQAVALVTLPCPQRGVRALKLGNGKLRITQTRPVLSLDQVAQMLRELGLPDAGEFALELDFPPGGGAGMSTAALVAVARAAGGLEEKIARACLAVEGASDPLMLKAPDGVLWASRSGRSLGSLPAPPKALVVGGFWGSHQCTDAQDQDFAPIADLVADWARAPGLRRAAAIGSESALRTMQTRGPQGDPTPMLVRDLGALGWVRAHTGSARGLIFAPDATPDLTALVEAGFTDVLSFVTGRRR